MPTFLRDFTVQFSNGSHCHQGGHISTAHFVPVGLIPTNSYKPYLISWERCVELKIESSLCLVVWPAHSAKLYLIGHCRSPYLYEIDLFQKNSLSLVKKKKIFLLISIT